MNHFAHKFPEKTSAGTFPEDVARLSFKGRDRLPEADFSTQGDDDPFIQQGEKFAGGQKNGRR